MNLFDLFDAQKIDAWTGGEILIEPKTSQASGLKKKKKKKSEKKVSLVHSAKKNAPFRFQNHCSSLQSFLHCYSNEVKLHSVFPLSSHKGEQ